VTPSRARHRTISSLIRNVPPLQRTGPFANSRIRPPGGVFEPNWTYSRIKSCANSLPKLGERTRENERNERREEGTETSASANFAMERQCEGTRAKPEALFPRRNPSRSTRGVFRSHPRSLARSLARSLRLRFSSGRALSRVKRGRVRGGNARCDATALETRDIARAGTRKQYSLKICRNVAIRTRIFNRRESESSECLIIRE